MTDPLLSVADLRARIRAGGETVEAVDGVTFDVHPGETVCLVGESGSGKTVTCDSITGLYDAATEVEGEVRFDGRDLLAAEESALRAIRGDRLAYAFQNARGALDPVYTVGEQIVEAIRFHREAPDARERAVDLLGEVGLPRPADLVDEYPHELSDGMCQRVVLAVALAADPDLLIADEPTSALDVTIQARIVELLDDLRREREFALLLVTHDLRVVAALADRVVVLYEGAVVERGPADRVFARPGHPYTQSLVRSFVGEAADGERAPPAVEGCRFRRECPHAVDACADRPGMAAVDGRDDHRAACVFHGTDRSAARVLRDAPSVVGDGD